MNNQIITSLMDLDFYKFTMGQVVFHKYKGTKVRYKLFDRNNQHLGLSIPLDQLREQLDAVKKLKFSRSEIHYLRGTNEYADRMFREDYLEFLENLKLPEYELGIDPQGNIDLQFYGNWEEAIYWETLAMSIINQLYYQNLMKDLSRLEISCFIGQGHQRLKEKLDKLNKEIVFSEFGTRRRFQKEWQQSVINHLVNCKTVNLYGTSNTLFAMQYGLMPIGTFAHEMEMGISGVMYDDLLGSHQKALDDWWDAYGFGLSIALTDTFTTEFFFKSFGEQRARDWKGFRHDSGDPFNFAERVINYYDNLGIDARKRMIIFSDGLNADKIVSLHNTYKDRIRVTFGWGTDLTNDLGLKPLSIVVKMIESNGNPVVKLSDNPEKTIGNEEAIKKYKESFCK